MNCTSIIHAHSSPCIEHPRRVPPEEDNYLRGSLPLKKRKFRLLEDEEIPEGQNSKSVEGATDENPRPHDDRPSLVSPNIETCSSFINDSNGVGNSNCERIEALALVAAAAAATANHSFSQDASVVSDTGTEVLNASSLLTATSQIKLPSFNSTTRAEDTEVESIAFSRKRASSASTLSSNYSCSDSDGGCGNKSSRATRSSSPAPSTLKRVHHPPLTSPLPGGCHGRTSRNNSFCRRLPCYNGSKYCKLHYQQLRAAGEPLESKSGNEEPVLTTTTSLPIEVSKNESLIKSANKRSVQHQASAVAAASGHQDKRFTGSKDETRCQARTTRGKACAYVSVNATQYCYLHADYETNPPPRRGVSNQKVRTVDTSSVSSASPMVEAEASQPLHHSTSEGLRKRRNPPSSLAGKGSPGGALAPGSQSPKPKRRTATKLAEKHADSPYPLLSMISTDQWFHKKVMVSTGPLAGRIGKVEKWGNGWVTVSIPTIGQHNRRSFELYLRDDGGGVGNDNSHQRQTVAAVTGTLVVANNNQQHLNNASDNDLPQLQSASSEAKRLSPTINCIPNHPKEGSSSESEDQSNCSRPRSSTSTPLNNDHTMTPVTPRPRYEEVTIDSKEGNCAKTPILTKAECQEIEKASLLPKVTPSSPKKTKLNIDMPLVESLLLAQEGGSSIYHLDMLFGTAALERSRRTIKKPSNYSDTAMLTKRSYKQSR